MRENRLRWHKHIQRCSLDSIIIGVEYIRVQCARGRGKSNNINALNVLIDMNITREIKEQDSMEWRDKIYVTSHKEETWLHNDNNDDV